MSLRLLSKAATEFFGGEEMLRVGYALRSRRTSAATGKHHAHVSQAQILDSVETVICHGLFECPEEIIRRRHQQSRARFSQVCFSYLNDEAGKAAGPFPRDGMTALELGTQTQTTLSGAPVQGGLMDFAPAVDLFLKAHLFGDIFGRDNPDWQSREIATVSTLASLPCVESQLRSHFRISMNIGITPAQLKQITSVLGEKVDISTGKKARAVLDSFLGSSNSEIADGVIFPRGKENTEYAQYFVGTSYLNMLTTTDVPIGNVTFESGCRNNWHIHHKGGQIPLVTGGRG